MALAFSNISVVAARGRLVVDDVGGDVRAGELLVILGPSGSGKTSLLSVLAGEVLPVAGGVVVVSGQVGYVPQRDRLLPFVTVEETLRFASELRSGYYSPEVVEEVLETLGLGVVRETPVGSAERRGISGGEAKRLALGVELVNAADVVLCDEPTTGLDAKTALGVARLLSKVSKTVAVAATVHQPSTRIWALFDQLLVLSTAGRAIYAGPAADAETAAARLVGRPPDVPIAEFLLDVADEDLPKVATRSVAPTSSHSSRMAAPILVQVRVLLTRAVLSNRRSPTATYAALARSATMGLVIGGLYSHGCANDQRGVADRTGAIFFVLVNQGFSALSSIRVFLDERLVFLHESRRGAYGTLPYFIAKTLAEVPYQIAFATIFAGLAYFLAGLRLDLASAAVVVLATLVAESLALAVGAASPDPKTALALCPVVLSISLLFAGFLVSLDSLPPLLAPLRALSFFKHAFAALLKIEFANLETLTCTDADRDALATRLSEAGAPRALLKKITLPCPVPDGKTHVARVLGDAAAAKPFAKADLPPLLLLFFLFRTVAYLALARRARAAAALAAKIYEAPPNGEGGGRLGPRDAGSRISTTIMRASSWRSGPKHD
ncbi:hypothetical protein CTAYLR_006762 [Chrysophaeum taylorii]|uniref:ABC transporter domain-containing protein n=1 Tax=Chrysophaeum taylorii TaxID=2483200 RepID=A0AAD7UBJ0_9STRA|nr:hypothetical protein CTAYLR_006762 [Chrysophaeum taylorii]